MQKIFLEEVLKKIKGTNKLENVLAEIKRQNTCNKSHVFLNKINELSSDYQSNR